MKNIIRLFAIGAVALTGVSCEDFLSAEPVNRISAEFFFTNESDLELYCNGLLQSYCPSASTVGEGDNYTDLTASENSTDFYNCLLYTSPSPRDSTSSRMPSSA